MKNICYFMIIYLLGCYLIPDIFSQNICGEDSKISTTPDNPVNEREYPDSYKKLNRDMFDWRIEYFPIYSNSPYHHGYDFIISPFWDIDVEYEYIYKQFNPENGWELIRVIRLYVSETDRGDEKKTASDAILWVVLYNRDTRVN